MIRFLLQIIFLPIRLLIWIYYRLRNLRSIGPVLHHRVPDRFTMYKVSGWLTYFSQREDVHFIEYISLLRLIEKTRDLKTFLYSVPDVHFSLAEAEHIGSMLKRIRDSGKKLISFAEGGSVRTLYLCSFAHQRYSARASSYSLFMPAAEPYYFKGLLARFGIRVDAYAAGRYKSAGETFSRTGPTREARENLESLLDRLRGVIEDGFNPESRSRFRKQTIWEAPELVKAGFFNEEISEESLLDRVLDRPEIVSAHPFKEAEMSRAGSSQTEDTQKRKPHRLTNENSIVKRYARSDFKLLRLRRRKHIAFVSMEGAIHTGRHQDHVRSGVISAHAYRNLILELKDTSDQAVFISINSPGGSADGSELLYQAIKELADVKPVIAILGAVAASGGYYIACAAHRIYAMKSSITGSIGVIRIQPDASGLLKRWGVESARVRFDDTHDLQSISKPLSWASRRLLDRQLKTSYEIFVERVASGRKKDPSEVKRFAEGRVWTGIDFQERGMIDGIADFPGILEIYKKAAGIPESRRMGINFYPDVKMDLRGMLGVQLPGMSMTEQLQNLASFAREGNLFLSTELLGSFLTGAFTGEPNSIL